MTFKADPPLSCFLITPFDEAFTPVSRTLKELLEERFAGVARRADDYHHPGNIMDDVTEGIQESDFCIADVTNGKANVLWEAGFAGALGRPIIQISQSKEALPFDIRPLRTLVYELENLNGLKDSVAKAIAAVMERLDGFPRLLGSPYDELSHTGTMLRRRLVEMSNGAVEGVFSVLTAALIAERKRGIPTEWRSDEAERLMKAIERVDEKAATDAFWWMIVHGILVYPDIDGPFQRCSAKQEPLDRWQDNVDLVSISERGIQFLTKLKSPLRRDAR